MIPRNYKFHIVNNSGVTIEFSTDDANNTFTIKGRGWKYTSAGALSYGSEQTCFADPASDLANGASLEAAAEVDNSTDLFIGMHFVASLVTDAATNGTLDIYYEYSTDGGTTYPSDAADFDPEEDLILASSIKLGTTTEDRTVNFEL